MSGWLTRFRKSVIENPFTWFLVVLFAFVEYANYQKGVTIDRMCELTGSHEGSYSHPSTAREELDTICVNRQADD